MSKIDEAAKNAVRALAVGGFLREGVQPGDAAEIITEEYAKQRTHREAIRSEFAGICDTCGGCVLKHCSRQRDKCKCLLIGTNDRTAWEELRAAANEALEMLMNMTGTKFGTMHDRLRKALDNLPKENV